MHININYFLPAIGEQVLGAQLQLINIKQGAVQLEQGHLTIMGIGDFIITFYNPGKGEHYAYLISPKGNESIAGDLFGFEFKEWVAGNYTEHGYSVRHMLNDLGNTVKGISAFGDSEEFSIKNQKEIEFWYKNSGVIPDKILVSKKTIQVIAIEHTTENWTYFISFGKNDYRIHVDIDQKPEVFIKKSLMKQLKLVDKIN